MFTQRAHLLSTPKKIVAFLVLTLAIAAIWLGGIPLMTRKTAEGYVADFTAAIAEHARREQGIEASFTHDGVTMEGMPGLPSRAVVTKPAVAWARAGGSRMTLSTLRAVMRYAGSSSSTLMVEFPDPLVTSEDGTPHSVVTFDAPPYLEHARRPGTALERFYSLTLPPKLTLSKANADGTPGAAETVVTFGSTPVIQYQADAAGLQALSTVQAQNVIIAGAKEGGSLSIGNFQALIRRDAPANGRVPMDISITAADIGLRQGDGMSGPYNVRLATVGTRAAADTPEAAEDVEYDVRELSLSGEGYTLSLKGSLNRKPDDSLPFGAGEVTVRNYPELIKSLHIPDELTPAVNALVSHAAGVDVNTTPDFSFPIAREKLGTTTIGSVSFQELMTMAFGQLMGGGQGAPQPVPQGEGEINVMPLAPPENAPAPESIPQPAE